MKSEMCVDVFLFLVFLSRCAALLATFHARAWMLQVLETLAGRSDCWIIVAEVRFVQKYDGKIQCQCIILFSSQMNIAITWGINPQLFWHNLMGFNLYWSSKSNRHIMTEAPANCNWPQWVGSSQSNPIPPSLNTPKYVVSSPTSTRVFEGGV